MAQDTNSLKKLSLLGLAVLGVLFIGGIVFYKERLYFSDASYIVFNIIRYDHLFIQENRFGSFITQMIPLLASKLHLPVSAVLKSYAYSFNFFYLLVGCVVYRCRQYGLLMVMACTYTLLVTDTYFWTNNEIHQALAWMFLFFAVVLRMGERRLNFMLLLPVFLILATVTLYTHFIVIIPMAFLWGYFWIGQDNWHWNRKTSMALTAILVAIVASKFVLLNSISYEAGHLHNVTHFTAGDIWAATHDAVVKKFAKRMVTIYWPGALVFIAGVVVLILNKRKSLLLWTLLSFAGYIVIMGLTYTAGGGDILLFHIESEWESMAAIMAAPFVFVALPKMQLRYAILVLSVLFFVRFGYIISSGSKFIWRTSFKEQVLAQMKKKNITKLAINSTGYLEKKNILHWALPEESFLMSTMQGDVPARTFFLIEANDSGLIQALSDPKKVQLSFNAANENYSGNNYIIPDTGRPYSIMTFEELFRGDYTELLMQPIDF